MFTKYKALPYALLTAAVFVVYANVYSNPFLMDDLSLVVNNIFLRSPDYIGKIFTTTIDAGSGVTSTFYRPLTIFLYFILYQMSGLSLVGYHALNISLHAANACLVYRLGKQLNFNPVAVFLAALIWAVDPLHTEVVAYVGGMADPLYSFFCLLGISILVPSFTSQRIWISAGCYALALLSKETAIIFPALVASCMLLIDPNRYRLRTYIKLWHLLLVGTLYLLMRVEILGINTAVPLTYPGIYDHSILCRFYTFLSTLPAYAALLIWPNDLYFDRQFLAQITFMSAPVLIGAGLSIFAIWQMTTNRHPALRWALLWFAIADALYAGIIQPLNFVICEHWLYLSMVGLVLGGAECLTQLGRRLHLVDYKQSAIVLSLVAACALGAKTLQQNRIWSDPDVFYKNILAHNPNSGIALESLSVVAIRRGDPEDGIMMIRRALALGADTALLHNNLAIALMNSAEAPSHIDEIREEFERALALDPDYYRSYFGLSGFYQNLGDGDKSAYYRSKGNDTRHRLGLPSE